MDVDPLVVAIFGPPPEGIDLSANSEAKNAAVVLTLLLISALFLAGRIVIRTQQVYGLSLDDYAIIISWVFVAATGAMVVVVGQAGAGKHVWALTIDQMVEVSKLSYIYTYFFAISVFTTKVSILLFYRRLFSRGGFSFKIAFWFGTFLVAAYPVIFLFTMILGCTPISHYWTQFKGTEGTCIDVGQFFVILAIINLFTNVIVLLIPVPEVLKLQMNREKKGAVFGILALGGLVCIASAVRVYYLDVFAKAADNTWAMGTVAIWSSVEPSMGIVSACLPSFKSFLRYLRRKGGSKSRSSFPTISNGGKGNRLRFDDEIALRSQIVGGEGSMHSGQGSEAGRQIYVKTDVEQVITEIPEAMRRSNV
ncbi:related to integral membrane protein [Fusarium mangiferae]|uniref:Related to integral membrane protein n=1 Tax=Fusarium mangiferae TaxID=192010 RepID=A0A1L7T880_FUSMA|nr:uncharacterized protein FMAN_13209 [Fusarium mangiferae]CVK94930.1 related to integral membrane protein [Fusarium mangiferae]